MKLPVDPPDYMRIFSETIGESKDSFYRMSEIGAIDERGRYLHWDKLRHLDPPSGFNNEQWWAAMKISRSSNFRSITFKSKLGNKFKYCVHESIEKELHQFDLHAAGNMTGDGQMANSHIKSTFLIKSLVEEAINSSQLEGASTTRNVAKEMIRQGRDPKDKSEQMILNNFHAMQLIREFKDEKLTPSMIMHLHKILTEKTLDDPNKAGEFRSESDEIHVVDEATGKILHTPPASNELQERMELLCKFANNELDTGFIHPVIRAVLLHFMLAYDHPFVDGNGRTARALFYWSMANQKYWLMEFISISKIIKAAPSQYGKAFLYTETDDDDVTYFISHQIDVIKRAIEELHLFLDKKMRDISYAEELLQNNDKLRGKLNLRQLALLRHALKHPRFMYNINEHQNSNGISYDTARKDLMQMADKLKLLVKLKMGKTYAYVSPSDLEERIGKH